MKTPADNHPHSSDSVLSYEIRHPLTNIMLAAEMLESKLKSDDVELLDIIRRNAIRINILLNECINQHTEQYS